MAMPIAVPTGKPGELLIPSLGRTILQVEWREDDFYDTVQAPNAITSGKELLFFRDLTNKNLQHTNLPTPRRLPSGSELIMNRIGLHIGQAYGNMIPADSDILLLAHAAAFTFKINDRVVAEGPVVKFQSGYGVAGSTTRNATGVVTLGVPSAAAAPSLFVAQSVKDNDDLYGRLVFQDDAWLTEGSIFPTFSSYTPAGGALTTVKPTVTAFLHGMIKKPVGN